MKRKLQTAPTPAAVQPGITVMAGDFRPHAELETGVGELLTSQKKGGDNAAFEWELATSYEERFIELLSIFAPPDGCTAVLGSY